MVLMILSGNAKPPDTHEDTLRQKQKGQIFMWHWNPQTITGRVGGTRQNTLGMPSGSTQTVTNPLRKQTALQCRHAYVHSLVKSSFFILPFFSPACGEGGGGYNDPVLPWWKSPSLWSLSLTNRMCDRKSRPVSGILTS